MWIMRTSLPALAISMQASETEDEKERYPDFFEINMLRCIYCGYCEEVCPEEAIVMSKDYDIVFESREDAVYDKERLLVPKTGLSTLKPTRILSLVIFGTFRKRIIFIL